MTELVEHLRARKDDSCDEAAAHIEALTAKLERAREALASIAHETRRQQLPITAQVNEIAIAALKEIDSD